MPSVTESQWLAYNGFQRFPFERPEAGNEDPEYLKAYFLDPENFSSILGRADSPTTALLFAARGTGKTACRIMVDYYCRTGNIPIGTGQDTSYVLSIPHTHLYLIASQENFWDSTSQIQTNRLIDNHVREILRRAMPALSDLLATSPDAYNAVRNFSPALKQDLGWLVLSYAENLTSPQRFFLRELLDNSLEQYFLDREQQINFNPQSNWDLIALKAKRNTSPLDQLSQLASLIHKIGIVATYVLIDGVDEYMETAADPEKAYKLIQPLLGTLQLMDKIPYLALKFFLPDSLEPLIKSDPVIRIDRGFTFQTIYWTDSDLIEILRRRMNAAKPEKDTEANRYIARFDALCVSELHNQIEMEMVRETKGNPRHLIVLAGLMVRAHFDRDITDQDDPYKLNWQDWKIALEKYKLRIMRRNNIVEKTSFNILQLIKQGENEQIEFKESLRWDSRERTINRKLEYVIAKTIAAFLNKKGGALLIGVADNGQIVGLEHDLKNVKHKNIDGFQQKITQIVEKYLGFGATHYIYVSFDSIENKQVCLVKIKRSQKPIYVRVNRQSEFWVRIGNVTRELDVESAHSYIETHWEKKHSGN